MCAESAVQHEASQWAGREHELRAWGTHQTDQALDAGAGAAQALTRQRGQQPCRAATKLCGGARCFCACARLAGDAGQAAALREREQSALLRALVPGQLYALRTMSSSRMVVAVSSA